VLFRSYLARVLTRAIQKKDALRAAAADASREFKSWPARKPRARDKAGTAHCEHQR
jgi:hypothetical protein